MRNLLIVSVLLVISASQAWGRGWVEDKEAGQQRITTFKDWLVEHGVDISHLDIKVDQFGYSVYLKESVKPLNITIPAEIMITFKSVEDSEAYKKMKKLGVQMSKFSEADRMAVWLLAERNNPDSKWKPYLDCLPRNMTTPHFYTPKEKAHAAMIPFVGFDDLAKAQAAIYKQFFPRLYIRHPELWNRKTSQLSDFRWAYAVIRSRMFRVKTRNTKRASAKEPRELDVGSLVPLADMLDHNGDAKVAYNTRKSMDDPFVIRFHDTIKPGARMFNNYGDHTDYDFLQQYGFIEEKVNPNDYIYFSISNMMETHEREALRNLGIPDDGRIRLYKDKYPTDAAKVVSVLWGDRDKEEQNRQIKNLVKMRMDHWVDLDEAKFVTAFEKSQKAVDEAADERARRHAYNFRNLDLLALKHFRLLKSVIRVLEEEDMTKDDL